MAELSFLLENCDFLSIFVEKCFSLLYDSNGVFKRMNIGKKSRDKGWDEWRKKYVPDREEGGIG